MLVKRREQETELVLEIVQVGDRTVREVGRFKYEPFGHEAATPQMIEHNQAAAEESVRNWFGHKSDALGIVLPTFAIVRHLRDAVQVINKLVNRSHVFGGFVN